MLLFKSYERMKLGQEYYLLMRKLSKYDMIPEFLWTIEQKEEVVEILEKMFNLDVELEDHLIKDGDELGVREFKKNQAIYTDRLWKLKQDLQFKEA